MLGKIFIVLLIPITIYVVYYLLNRTAKNNKAIKRVLSNEGKDILEQEVDYYGRLSAQDKQEFETRCLAFLDTVKIEGVGVTVELKDYMLIAASAIIPIFAFKKWTYPNLTNIMVYPSHFNADYQFEGHADRNIMGMVGEGAMNGQMILSKSALEYGFKNANDGQNTAIHEFVHLIDKIDGTVDGLPTYLLDKTAVIPFMNLIREEINKIKTHQSDIDTYGMTNPGEFFAVASEYFFENPAKFQKNHPALYAKLSAIFEQSSA
ncbi:MULTISPECIES: zinc-dependent peptidase [unclassified Sphingobacterium]|uniref:M90 family metallopeptidase n=1 Tax=unclassified Sphingobacterium TaxID=2609468 RepID=UPI0025DA3D10|nr:MULTISPECIES: M90 family metallopeptidase [unclassified Sphingobacterium]